MSPVATIVNEVSLEPLPRSILQHIRKRGSISTMEAMVNYGTLRLAAAVEELRRAGYEIATELRTDEAGKRYSRYSMRETLQ